MHNNTSGNSYNTTVQPIVQSQVPVVTEVKNVFIEIIKIN